MQAITQVILTFIAIALVFLVVKPRLALVQDMQQQIATYSDAIDKATQYNSTVSNLKSRIDNLSAADKAALQTYMPNRVNVLMISRDIEAMVVESGMSLEDISADDADTSVSTIVGTAGGANDFGLVDYDSMIDPETGTAAVLSGSNLKTEALQDLVSRTFTLTALGSYDEFKQLLMNIESNTYPLRIISMSFVSEEDSDLTSYELTLRAFALTETTDQTQ